MASVASIYSNSILETHTSMPLAGEFFGVKEWE
jgi:hypothetical protein